MNGKLRNVVVRIKSAGYSHKKTNMDAFTFTATVASRGYQVYKTTSWIIAKVGDKVTVTSLETDPYGCAIRIKNKYFSNRITVGHIHVKFHGMFTFSSRRKAEKLIDMLNLNNVQTINYTIWGFRNPTTVNIFVWVKGNLRHTECFRKQYF